MLFQVKFITSIEEVIIRLSLFIFCMTIFLASSLSLAAPQYKIAVNQYFDFETGTNSGSLNNSHDVKCTSYAVLTPVNTARARLNATGGTSHLSTNLTDVIGSVWDQSGVIIKTGAGAARYFGYFVSTEWNYTKISSNTATSGYCEFDVLEISVDPYFEGTSAPSTYEITLAQWEGSWWDALFGSLNTIYFSIYDLGMMTNNLVGTSHSFQTIQGELKYLNSTNYYDSSDQDSSATRMSEAQCFVTSAYGYFNFTEINQPPGYYDIYCWNSSVTNRPATGAVMLKDNTPGSSGSMRMAKFNADYFVISNVDHDPDNPLPNMSTVITWDTTQQADSRIYWRSAPLSNQTNLTGWSSKYLDESVYTHDLTINGTYIIENRFYQYWVESNRSGTVVNATNSGLYYNFSVGGIYFPIVSETPEGYENQTAPVLNDAAENLATQLGLDVVIIINIIAIFIVSVFSIVALYCFKNPLFSAVIFITFTAVFTVIGFLPWYFFIILSLIFAFAMVKLMKGLFQ